MDHLTLSLFIIITLFHVYLGFGGKINHAYILPKINGHPLPYHSAAVFPVAILLTLSTLAFAQEANLIQPLLYSHLFKYYLLITGIGLIARGFGGLVFFHLLNKIIDDTPFKSWDLKLYSPLTIFLGTHCLLVLQ